MAGNSVYPGAIDSVATLPTDLVLETDAGSGLPRIGRPSFFTDLLNNLNDAVRKIQFELGADPAGTFVDVVTRLAARQTCRKTADQAFTTQTLANVTDLSFVVAASLDYYFKFVCAYTGGTARGIGLGVTCPASPTFLAYSVDIHGITATDGTAGLFSGSGTSSGDAVSSAATVAGTHIAVVEGVLSNGANAGTLQLQARQGTGATAANANVRKGSYGELHLN